MKQNKTSQVTIRFHCDFAIAKRSEDGSLGSRLRRGKK